MAELVFSLKQVTRKSPDDANLEVSVPVKIESITKESSENVGKSYPVLDVGSTKESVINFINFVGIAKIARILRAKAKAAGQNWFFNEDTGVLDKDGTVHEDVWEALASKFSARGETIKDLIDSQLELAYEMAELGDTPEDDKRKLEILSEIRANKSLIEAKKRETKPAEVAKAA